VVGQCKDMKYGLISADRAVSSFMRTAGNSEVNVQDVYEWIGEANGYLSVPTVLRQSLMFLEVKDYHADIPKGFKSLLQIAKDNQPSEVFCNTIPETVVETTTTTCDVDSGILLGCDGKPLCEVPLAFYRPAPFYNPYYVNYNNWISSTIYQRFTPVRAATNTLFKSSVCKEQDWKSIYDSSIDEYTIVNEGKTNRKFRFTFKEGVIAMSYLEDFNSNGVPLLIDNQSHLSAVQYYLLWKHSERMMMNGIQGSVSLNDRFEAKWLKYCKMAKNEAMMPTLGELDNIYQNTFKLLPSLKSFSNMFSDLSKEASASYILNENLKN
jgi:hypothetical protein